MRVRAGKSESRFWQRYIALMLLALTLMISALVMGLPDVKTARAESKPLAAPVVVIPVHHTVETGLYNFLERAFREAEEMNALHIILDVNTFGGRVDSAQEIGQLIKNSPIPTIAFVRGKAISAGSYIALNAEQIAMEPGSSIGAAAVVDITGNEIENAKVISTWSGLMKGAAEMRGRNSQIAEAMVDKNVGVTMTEIGRTVPKGEIVTLTSEEALKVGYAETVAASLDDVVKFIGGENHPLITMELSVAERLARFVTEPWVATLLLLIGIAGVAIEIFVPGFGLPGILGVTGFGLYFFGHYIAGFAGVEHIALFVGGIVLLFLEIFVSSFGILGILGALCLFSGVVLSAYNKQMAVWSLGIAFVAAAVIVAIVIRIFRHRGVWHRFILSEKLTTEQGYVSASSRKELMGQAGHALTPLRPAGTAVFGEERVDVVTSGEFIAAGSAVTVVQVDGSRIVVKEWKET